MHGDATKAGPPQGLRLPARTDKPRDHGLTLVIDRGTGCSVLEDLLDSAAHLVDYVKFGWGTSYVVANLDKKVDLLRAHGVGFYFGGTLLEVFLLQNQFDAYRKFIDRYRPSLVEVSDGVVDFKPGMKQAVIAELARDYRVISEVGKKDPEQYMAPSSWVAQIQADRDAGAWKVVCEAREGGGSGIFRKTGELRYGLVDEIRRQISADDLVFEAPVKSAQTWFIQHFGANVNLGNIATTDVVPLETLRLGLRADTIAARDLSLPSPWLADAKQCA